MRSIIAFWPTMTLPTSALEFVDEGRLFVYEFVDDPDVHGGAQLTTDVR
jgi:hypothetical protein